MKHCKQKGIKCKTCGAHQEYKDGCILAEIEEAESSDEGVWLGLVVVMAFIGFVFFLFYS